MKAGADAFGSISRREEIEGSTFFKVSFTWANQDASEKGCIRIKIRNLTKV